MAARTYRPVYIDHAQSADYRHVLTTVRADGSVWSHFANGAIVPSVYRTEAALLAAGRQDWRERVR